MKIKIDKKHVTTFALAGIMLANPVIALAAEFKDVPGSHWAYSYISRLSDSKVINGYPDQTYRPENSVQYLEVMKLLQGVMNPSQEEVGKAVQEKGYIADEYGVPSWAREAVSVALYRNVITEINLKQAAIEGLVSNRERTDYPSRQTIAVYYAKALKLTPTKDHSVLKYKDMDKLGQVNDAKIGQINVADYLAALVKAGILAADGSEGKFDPNRPIRRSEMAKITDLSTKYLQNLSNTETLEAKVLYIADISGNKTLALTMKDGSTVSANILADSKITKNGNYASASDLKEGQTLKIKARKTSEKIYEALEVDIISTDIKVVGKLLSNNAGELTIAYTSNENLDFSKPFYAEKTEKFTLAKDVKVKQYGKEVSLGSITSSDFVEFVAQDNTIKEINLIPKSAVVTGTVKYISDALSAASPGKIQVTLDNGKTYEFNLSEFGQIDQALDAAKNSTKKYDITLNYKNVTKIDTAIISNVNEGMLTGFNGDNIILNIGNGSKEYVLDSTVSIRQEDTYKTSYTKEKAFNELFYRYKDSMVRLKEVNGKVTEITIMTQPLTMYSTYATINAQEPVSLVSGFNNGTRYFAEYEDGGSTNKISFITEDSYVNGSKVLMTIYKEAGEVKYLKVEDKFVTKSN